MNEQAYLFLLFKVFIKNCSTVVPWTYTMLYILKE